MGCRTTTSIKASSESFERKGNTNTDWHGIFQQGLQPRFGLSSRELRVPGALAFALKRLLFRK